MSLIVSGNKAAVNRSYQSMGPRHDCIIARPRNQLLGSGKQLVLFVPFYFLGQA